jgi:hypothetical protein
LIEGSRYSFLEINNIGDDPLSACPQGAMLEKQSCVAYMDVFTQFLSGAKSCAIHDKGVSTIAP